VVAIVAEELGRACGGRRRLAAALLSAKVQRLTAISNEPPMLEEMVYELDATEEDLAAFDWEFLGINALLLPRSGVDLAVLFCTDDFHLVAGTRQFVTDYAGDLHAARAAFLDFINDHFKEMRPFLWRVAARYMAWIDFPA
jgi:hypothetical protein